MNEELSRHAQEAVGLDKDRGAHRNATYSYVPRFWFQCGWAVSLAIKQKVRKLAKVFMATAERAREEMTDLRSRLESEKAHLQKLIDEAQESLQAEKDSHAATRQKVRIA
jgi:hypothetical protein